MRLRIVAMVLAVCLLLSGCGSWMDGSYSSVKLHTQRPDQVTGDTASVTTYEQLRQKLAELVENDCCLLKENAVSLLNQYFNERKN